MKKTLLAASLLTFTLSAHAIDWRTAGGSDRVELQVAVDRIQKSGTILNIWTKYIYKESQNDGAEYAVDRMALDCATISYNTLQIVDYRPDGTVASQQTPTTGWKAALPETVMETFITNVCAYAR